MVLKGQLPEPDPGLSGRAGGGERGKIWEDGYQTFPGPFPGHSWLWSGFGSAEGLQTPACFVLSMPRSSSLGFQLMLIIPRKGDNSFRV